MAINDQQINSQEEPAQNREVLLEARGVSKSFAPKEKQVFRDQALSHIEILRQIVHALEGAPGHTLPEEYFLSLLDEHFDEDEAQAQLETAINWGRYAELFAFQDARGVFRLEEPETAETI